MSTERKTSPASLSPELGFLPEWVKLPHCLNLPPAWMETIQRMITRTSETGKEIGVLGYLPSSKFQPQDIKFGELTLGDEHRVALKRAEERFLFSSPGSPVVDIHTHPISRLKEELPSGLVRFSSIPIPSGIDLAQVLYNKKRWLNLVILPRDKGPHDIDLLVKCPETTSIGSPKEFLQVISSFNEALDGFRQKIINSDQPAYLIDFKRLFGTVAGAYKVSYYSSFDPFATYQDLTPGGSILLKMVYPENSLDDFLRQPLFLEHFSYSPRSIYVK